MSTTLIHLMKLATANDVVIQFRPTQDITRGHIRMWDAVETEPDKVHKVERLFDYRAFSTLVAADEISMDQMIRALQNLVESCNRKLVIP